MGEAVTAAMILALIIGGSVWICISEMNK
jgi:hypothetical protein